METTTVTSAEIKIPDDIKVNSTSAKVKNDTSAEKNDEKNENKLEKRMLGDTEYEYNYASNDYSKVHLASFGQRHVVPLLKSTKENLQGYGELIDPAEYFSGKVKTIISQWPRESWRPIDKGTGYGPVAKGKFFVSTFEDYYVATNTTFDNRYIIGRVPSTKREGLNSILVREANYHPCGGQIMVPISDGKTMPRFIMLLAKPTDDVKPEDFRAFLFEGDMGFQIFPKVWHKPIYSLCGEMHIANEQSEVHAVVCADIFDEFGKYLEICF